MSRKTFINPLFLLLIATAILIIPSCGNDNQEFLFEVDYAFNIEIPAGQPTFQSLVIPFESLSSQIAAELAARGLSVDEVTAVQTSRARIDLLSFDGDLSVFHTIVSNIYLGTNPLSNPYEAGYTIEIRDRFTERIDIVPSLTDLTDVLRRDIFNMELVMSWRRINPSPMQARYTISFGVVE